MGERRILEKDESWTKLNRERKRGGERKGERRGREAQKKGELVMSYIIPIIMYLYISCIFCFLSCIFLLRSFCL